MKRVSLARAVAAAFFFLSAACGLVLKDYQLDTTLLDTGSCEEGQFRCSTDWLMTCNATLDGWVRSTSCDSAELCNGRAARCDSCRGGELRCSSARLEVCRDDGSGWDLVETCASADKCNVNLEACVACTPGEFQCNQGAWSVCSAQGGWGAATACMPSELCYVADDRKSGGCATFTPCSPETHSCNGAVLSRCDKQGVSLQAIETCASVPLCQMALGGSGLTHCVAPACKLGGFGCNGNTLQTCKAELNGFMDTATICTADTPCNPQTGTCGKCAQGSFFCQQAALLRCNASGVFEKTQDCASAALCDAASGSCKPAECEAFGVAECDADLPNLLRVCGSDLTWGKAQLCDTGALCNAVDARCEAPSCAANARRCDHGQLQHCNSDQTGWRTDQTCGAGSECDLETGGCVPAGCVENEQRCNDLFLERCIGNAWTRLARCEFHSLCDPAAPECKPAECKPGEFKCGANTLDVYRCEEGSWPVDPLTSCQSPTTCDAMSGTCK